MAATTTNHKKTTLFRPGQTENAADSEPQTPATKTEIWRHNYQVNYDTQTHTHRHIYIATIYTLILCVNVLDFGSILAATVDVVVAAAVDVVAVIAAVVLVVLADRRSGLVWRFSPEKEQES